MPDQENENPDVQPPTGEPVAESTAPAPTPEPVRPTSGLPAAPPLDERATRLSELAETNDNARSRRVIRRIVSFAVVILIGIGFTYFKGKNESDNAPAVGECAKSAGDDKIKKVSCDDPGAEFEVVSRVDDTNDGETACAGNPTVTSYYAYKAKNTGVGVEFVLCLTDH